MEENAIGGEIFDQESGGNLNKLVFGRGDESRVKSTMLSNWGLKWNTC